MEGGYVSAVEDYRNVTADDGSAEGRDWDAVIPAADAAIAALEADRSLKAEAIHDLVDRAEQAEAENERLKVCGNCDEWHPSGHRCYMGDDGTVFTDRMDRCHFTPSRWSERSTS